MLQTGSGKQVCFPEIFTYLTNMILEESQSNTATFLLEIVVPYSGVAIQPPTTSGTNP
jgi:hypothetical protein